MARIATTRTALVCLAALALGLGACQGGGLTGGGAKATGTPGGPARTQATGSMVAVGARDLAPVDAYFRAGAGGSNTRWILGDEVDVVASREYFAGILSVNRGPFVRRSDSKIGDDMLVTLTFLGTRSQASAANNPRVQLGTGVTVTAYKTLRVRLTKTVDPAVPVRIHITARGNASRGHRENIIQRGPLLTMGGNLRRTGNRWVWNPLER